MPKRALAAYSGANKIARMGLSSAVGAGLKYAVGGKAALAAKGAWWLGKKIYAYSRGSKAKAKAAPNTVFQNAKQGQGITYTYFKRRGKKNPFGKKVGKIVSKNNFRTNTAGRLQATVGKQQVKVVMSMGGATDVGQAYTTSGGIATEKFIINKLKGKVMFTNQDDSNSELVLYDIVCRRDNASASGVFAPNTAMDAGIAGTSSTSTTTKDSTNYGATPFMSPEFCQHFKILKVSRVMLATGASHEHTVSFGVNRIMNGEYYLDYSQYRNMTFYTLAITKGMPYNDSATNTQVSTGVTQVDYVAFTDIQYQNLSANATSYQYTNNNPTAFTIGEQVMDRMTGASVPEAAA
jgi:hypothetical protein